MRALSFLLWLLIVPVVWAGWSAHADGDGPKAWNLALVALALLAGAVVVGAARKLVSR